MNLLTIIMLVIALLKVIQGYKRGMVKEIISFITLIIICIIVVLAGIGLRSYTEREYIGLITAVFLLGIVGIVHHLLGLIFFSAKMVVKLPIIRWVDKLLGILVGALETVAFAWTIYAFVRIFDLGIIGQMILAYTEESPILLLLYRNNLVIGWVEKLSEMIPIIQF